MGDNIIHSPAKIQRIEKKYKYKRLKKYNEKILDGLLN